LDSNILVYAFSADRKTLKARQLLADEFTISAQVLNEFVNVSRRKYKIDWDLINIAAEKILENAADCLPLTKALNAKARTLARRYQLPFYEALILASALEADCDELITEDFQNGQRFGSLTIVNPFVSTTA
jgi:predicted nucleic acid-binding protein